MARNRFALSRDGGFRCPEAGRANCFSAHASPVCINVRTDPFPPLHSLVVTGRLNEVNPAAYIEDVLRRVMDHDQTRLDELLPDQWQAARAAAKAASVATA